MIFRDPERNLLVQDVNNRLVAVHASIGAKRPESVRDMETSLPLLLMGNWNGIIDERCDSVRIADRPVGCKCLDNLLIQFQPFEGYRQGCPNAPVWTCTNKLKSSGSYIDRIFSNKIHFNCAGCPSFKMVV